MEKRVLISRWFGPDTQPIAVYDEASVSSARERVRDAGRRSNLPNQVIETVALITSELTHNHLSHARQGYFAVRPVEREGAKGLEVLAADIGPGIERPGMAIREQIPPKQTGSLGAGLSAVCRLADEVEFDNRISEGACIVARKFESSVAARCDVAIMGKPFPGELISGDDAVMIQSEAGFLAAVCDGLGHGPEAREASNRAMEVVSQNVQADLRQIVFDINDQLARTRGCAISIMRFDRQSGTLEYVSAGDVYAHLYHLREAHFFTPVPMVLGSGPLPRQRVRLETTSVKPGSVLVMFTDGLKSRTTLKGEMDTLRQPAIVIAQHLLETHSRPDDDALVCVARFIR
jgi:anti-sigma regulatory factor (Ser/Thr protein kinase)